MKADLSGTPVYYSANSIGGKVAGNTKVTAVYALLASLGMIVLYVWLRFQNVAFGLAAVVALIHDVLVAVACLAMSHYVAPFLGWALVDDFKISLDVVAALLTIIGFSINDTIVIFDRIREDLKLGVPGSFKDLVNRALNETLSRTIITSGTVFLATASLYLFGGGPINDFAFTFLVGIITGTYSSIYIASALVLWWHKGKRPSIGMNVAGVELRGNKLRVNPSIDVNESTAIVLAGGLLRSRSTASFERGAR
jgi:SecD/SecF fusion protein